MQDPAFASQEFALRAAQEQNRYTAAQGEALAHGLPGIPQAFQQGQLNQMRLLASQSELANDQMRRQQAAEELQWARELHTTDMLALQKEQMQAETSLRIAQVRKMQHDLESGNEVPFKNLTQEEVWQAQDLGFSLDLQGGRVRVRKATDEEQQAARSALQARRGEQARQRAAIEFAGRHGGDPAQYMQSGPPRIDEFGYDISQNGAAATPLPAGTAVPVMSPGEKSPNGAIPERVDDHDAERPITAAELPFTKLLPSGLLTPEQQQAWSRLVLPDLLRDLNAGMAEAKRRRGEKSFSRADYIDWALRFYRQTKSAEDLQRLGIRPMPFPWDGSGLGHTR